MSNQSPGRVFVTQEARTIDYTPARAYGSVEFVTLMDFSPEEASLNNVVLVDEIRAKLQDFDPEQDYVVFTGSPTAAAAAFMVLRERVHKVRMLRWSNRDGSYAVVTINLA